MLLERMHLQLSDHVVEPGPFIRTEVDEFTPEIPGSTPAHHRLGNVKGRFMIRRMDPQLEGRPRLHFNKAEDTAASDGKIVEGAVAGYNIRRAE